MTVNGLMLWGVLGLMLVAALQREQKAAPKAHVIVKTRRRRR